MDQNLSRLAQLLAGLGEAPADLGLAIGARGRAHGAGGHHLGDARIVHGEPEREAAGERMADHTGLACRQEVEHRLGLGPPEGQIEIGLLRLSAGGAEADQVGGDDAIARGERLQHQPPVADGTGAGAGAVKHQDGEALSALPEVNPVPFDGDVALGQCHVVSLLLRVAPDARGLRAEPCVGGVHW